MSEGRVMYGAGRERCVMGIMLASGRVGEGIDEACTNGRTSDVRHLSAFKDDVRNGSGRTRDIGHRTRCHGDAWNASWEMGDAENVQGSKGEVRHGSGVNT